MRLIIAEKPSVGRDIARALGIGGRGKHSIGEGETIVTWCRGHLLEQAEPAEYDEGWSRWSREILPMIPPAWKLVERDGAADQIREIRRLLKRAKEVVHAGDPDREGQLLVDEVLEYLGWKGPVKRVLINSKDQGGIRRAFEQIADNGEPRFRGLHDSALGRSRADWLVGLNLTRALTVRAREVGHDRVYHAGRVQTPTLALVAAREEEIANFRAVDYFVPWITAVHEKGGFRAKWVAPEGGGEGIDAEGRIVDRDVARRIVEAVSGGAGKIASVEEKKKTEQPPMPYRLASLQAEAGKRYRMDPDQVLAAAQALYDAGVTSYPRTESEYLPEDLHGDAAQILDALAGHYPGAGKADPGRRHRAWNTGKCPVHHGIVPLKGPPADLPEAQRKIFDLIAARYIGLFLPPTVYMKLVVLVEAGGQRWRAEGSRIVEGGWREILGVAPEDRLLPAGMAGGDPVEIRDAEIRDERTKPPKRFTPSTLLAAMEQIHRHVTEEKLREMLKAAGGGLGTAATRDRIIADLIARGYLEKRGKGGELRTTEAARDLLRAMPADLKSPGLTALWESFLSKVEAGSERLEKFEAATEKAAREMVRLALEAEFPAGEIHPCPECGRALRRRKGRKGYFWGCTGYPECEATLPDAGGKPGERASRAISGGPCPTCGEGTLFERTVRKGKHKGKRFWGCDRYPDCDHFEWAASSRIEAA